MGVEISKLGLDNFMLSCYNKHNLSSENAKKN